MAKDTVQVHHAGLRNHYTRLLWTFISQMGTLTRLPHKLQ
jgi:hypothetical protein